MKTFAVSLAYFLKKVAAGAKVAPQEIRYVIVSDRANLGSPMKLGNMPIIEVGIYAKSTQYLTWQC